MMPWVPLIVRAEQLQATTPPFEGCSCPQCRPQRGEFMFGATLLRRILTESELERLKDGRGIPVIGSLGGAYLLGLGSVSGRPHNSTIHYRFCVAPRNLCYHPSYDPAESMAGVLLALKTDEAGFLREAVAS